MQETQVRGNEIGIILIYTFAASVSCQTSNSARFVAAEPTKVTASMAAQLVEAVSGLQKAAEFVQIFSAFEVPYVKYDPIRKAFHRSGEPRSLHSTAQVPGLLAPVSIFWSRSVLRTTPSQDKLEVYMERFHVIQQRLRRNKLFSKPVLDVAASSTEVFVEVLL